MGEHTDLQPLDIPGRLTERVRHGASFGLALALILSAYITVLRLVSGTPPFERHGVSYAGVLAAYVGGGLVAGAVVGALWPLTRDRAGLGIVSGLGAFLVYTAVGMTMFGPPTRWGGSEWFTATLLGVVWGVLGAVAWFRPRKPATPLPPSRLRTVNPVRDRDPEA